MRYFISLMNKKNLDKFNILVLFLVWSTGCFAQFEERMEQLLQNDDLKNAEIGISILGPDGSSIYSHNAGRNMIPASLQKIITNFAALDHLGGQYEFETLLGYNGQILADGNLTGDIVIFGNGDPSLASERFQKRPQLAQVVDQLVSFITENGITCIDGEIICDASFYGSDATIHSWPWNDIGNYYATSTWSINVHENYYNLYFQLQNSKEKAPRIIRYSPIIPGLTFENDLRSGSKGSGDQSYIFGSPYTYNRIIRGSLPMGPGNFKIKGSIPDAPLYLAQLVAHKLSLIGIANNGPRVSYKIKLDRSAELGKLTSPHLKDLVKSANLESINLYCESFLVAIGKGNRDQGIDMVKAYLEKNKIEISDINIEDGSGLSFWNHISAQDFSKILSQLYAKYGVGLQPYFPKAGVSGTLSYMFKDKEAKGKLWAKTGSMNQVMNYAGFTTSKSGKNITFCIMINRHTVSNRKVRRIEEDIMEAIYVLL